MALLTMLVASVALVLAAVLAAGWLRTPSDSDLDHVLTVSLLLVTGVIVVSLSVGLVGLYRPLPLLLAALVLAAAATWLSRRGLRGRVRTAGDGEGRLRSGMRTFQRLVVRQPLAALAVAVAATAVVNRALIALLVPPGGFDAIAYHLVFVADWVQRGIIGGSELQRAGCCAWYPVNAEITYGWLAVFPHSDRLVGLAQVAYLVLGALATASITRSVGAADRYAVVAGALFALTPVALGQSATNQVDVALTAGVLLVAAFMLRLVFADDPSLPDVVRFGLAAAFAVGVKATAAPYVAAACAVLAVHVLL